VAEPVADLGSSMRAGVRALAPLEVREMHSDALTRDWRYPSTALSVRSMRRDLRPFLMSSELPDAEVDDLVLAACEAAANGIEHAQHPTEPFFDVQAEVEGRQVRIVVRDYGRWTMRRVGPGHRGRGLRMMTTLAAVCLTSWPLGTSVTLRNLVDGRSGG
jgi:anti-sigma regulatory factor (Ser/Thr protein kinase)